MSAKVPSEWYKLLTLPRRMHSGPPGPAVHPHKALPEVHRCMAPDFVRGVPSAVLGIIKSVYGRSWREFTHVHHTPEARDSEKDPNRRSPRGFWLLSCPALLSGAITATYFATPDGGGQDARRLTICLRRTFSPTLPAAESPPLHKSILLAPISTCLIDTSRSRRRGLAIASRPVQTDLAREARVAANLDASRTCRRFSNTPQPTAPSIEDGRIAPHRTAPQGKPR